jgi:hypothetical protein
MKKTRMAGASSNAVHGAAAKEMKAKKKARLVAKTRPCESKLVTALGTTAITAAAAAGTFFTGASFVDSQGASIEVDAIHGCDSRLGFLRGAHGDETKPAGVSGFFVRDEGDFGNRAVRREGVLQTLLGGVEGKVSNV